MKPLSQFSDAKISERLQGLAKNFYFFEGKLKLPADIEELFWETHDEVLKRGPIPNLEVANLISIQDPPPTFHESSVVRYSSKEYLNDLKSGIVSFGPAADYAKLLNKAQRDDELHRSWGAPNRILRINEVNYPATNIVLNQPIKERGGDYVNYHSLFVSVEESSKIQHAFSAEGYVVIRNYLHFYNIINEALEKELAKGHWGSGIVRYYDDRFSPKLKKISDLVFSKSVLFQYQREARLVVFGAPNPTKRFEIKVSWPFDLISEIRSF